MLRNILIITVILLASFQANAQSLDETDTGSIIKASYIYNFAKLIDWQDSKDVAPLKISVLGESNLYKQLTSKYGGRKIGNQTIEVDFIVEGDELKNIQILFISRKNKANLVKIIEKVKGNNVLIITENDGALGLGSVINFVSVNNVLKFEISEANASAHNLLVGSTLISLAKK